MDKKYYVYILLTEKNTYYCTLKFEKAMER